MCLKYNWHEDKYSLEGWRLLYTKEGKDNLSNGKQGITKVKDKKIPSSPLG